MIDRDHLLKVEGALYGVISACQKARFGKPARENGFQLLGSIEEKAAELQKAIIHHIRQEDRAAPHADDGEQHPAYDITAKEFERKTGQPPEDDDLERANCRKAGEHGHFGCGWCDGCDRPHFMCGCPSVPR